MSQEVNVSLLRAWLAEAARRAVARGQEIWPQTEEKKSSGLYKEDEDVKRWAVALDDAGFSVEREIRSSIPHTMALDHLCVAVREMAQVAGLQFRRELDGVVLDLLIPANEWIDSVWSRGTINFPPDPVAVVRLVDARLLPLLDFLEELDVIVPGAEAYRFNAKIRLAGDREADLEVDGEHIWAIGRWHPVPDSDLHHRVVGRRSGATVRLEVEKDDVQRNRYELGALPLYQSGHVRGVLKALEAAEGD